MDKPYQEWVKQAEYDMAAAEFMLSGGLCLHAIFTSHLAVEKALKGLYQARLKTEPPKTHDLLWLLKSIGARPPERLGRSFVGLNQTNVTTRYPESLDDTRSELTPQATAEMIRNAKEMLRWIRQQF